jgi:uncharacterized phage-associated protein
MNTKYLVTIRLQDGSITRFRSVLASEAVELCDVEFYYHTLLGFGNWEASIRSLEVPESFTLSLIGGRGNEIPEHFPSYDHEIADEEGVARYYGLIDRVLEMENMRLECGLATVDRPPATETTYTAAKPTRSRYMCWIQEMLEKFRSTGSVEMDTAEVVDDDTLAWIFTPVLNDIRESRGSRIVLDMEIGKRWGMRLGTELYPDLVLRRRITTVDWTFQHPSSAKLVRAAIEWYVEAQLMGEWSCEGVSPWIMNADDDLLAVLTPFKSVGPRQSFAMHGGKPRKDNIHPLMHVLRQHEGTLFVSQLSLGPEEQGRCMSISKELLVRFIRCIFKMNGIATDIIDTCWGPVEDIINLWIRSKYGICIDARPPFAVWEPMWDLLVRYSPTTESFVMFLNTLDVYEPITAITMSVSQKTDIARLWVRAFVDREMIRDSEERVSAILFYAAVREWCLKYTPESILDNQFKAFVIGPIMTAMGHPCHKTKKGRMIKGLRFRNPPTPEAAAAVCAAAGAGGPAMAGAAAAVGVVPGPGPSVLSYMMEGVVSSDDKVVVQSAADEIDLGNV